MYRVKVWGDIQRDEEQDKVICECWGVEQGQDVSEGIQSSHSPA